MTEKWTRLDYSDLAEVLAYDEIQKLNEMSLSSNISEICQKQLDSVADAFRGAFTAKGYDVDIRQHFVPGSYKMYVLAMARYYICARFPGSKDIFLDEPRYELFKRAQELLEDPILGTGTPDYSDDPQLSSINLKNADSSITLPFLRLKPQFAKSGFIHPIFNDYQLSCCF